MPKILITGNGFDLSFGLPTGYSDFIRICKKLQACSKFNWEDLKEDIVALQNADSLPSSSFNDFEGFKMQLDLLEKGIDIHIDEFVGSVMIDYKSISVVYTHLFDNIVKYIMPESDLSISFQNIGSKTWVTLEMTSMKITERDKLKIFDEGYSGEIAKESSNNGDGIGMFIAKRLMTLNRGIIRLKTGIDPMKKKLINDIPYETNQIILEFMR